MEAYLNIRTVLPTLEAVRPLEYWLAETILKALNIEKMSKNLALGVSRQDLQNSDQSNIEGMDNASLCRVFYPSHAS